MLRCLKAVGTCVSFVAGVKHTMLIPLVLPKAGVSLSIAGPVFKQGALQVGEEPQVKWTVTLRW